MKNFRIQIVFSALCGCISIDSCSSQTYVPGTTCSLSEMVRPIPKTDVQSDSIWNIWCGSMVKGDDGKYHLYYSRWPRSTGHESWISHSQIAYAVAEHPEGPYRDVNVALKAYNDTAWDGAMAHNPYIIKIEHTYYLYYIATRGRQLSARETITPYGTDWWNRRNTQRIGVASSTNPAGPWHRMKKPVLTVGTEGDFDGLCVTNPAVCVGRGGKIVMLYKGVAKNNTLSGGRVRFSVAFADSATGPFRKSHQLIFEPKDSTARMVAEDPFIWYNKKLDKYYAIARDVVRQFTGENSGGLALFESDDAIVWSPCKYPKVLPAILHFSDGSVYDAKANHVERPFVYFNNKGVPLYLFGAFSINKAGVFREHTFNARIPLR